MANRGSQISPIFEEGDRAPLTRHALGSQIELTKAQNGPVRQDCLNLYRIVLLEILVTFKEIGN